MSDAIAGKTTPEEIIRRLENKASQLRKRLIDAQARNYDLQYKHEPEPTQADLKARIDWLQSEIKRLIAERERYVQK